MKVWLLTHPADDQPLGLQERPSALLSVSGEAVALANWLVWTEQPSERGVRKQNKTMRLSEMWQTHGANFAQSQEQMLALLRAEDFWGSFDEPSPLQLSPSGRFREVDTTGINIDVDAMLLPPAERLAHGIVGRGRCTHSPVGRSRLFWIIAKHP